VSRDPAKNPRKRSSQQARARPTRAKKEVRATTAKEGQEIDVTMMESSSSNALLPSEYVRQYARPSRADWQSQIQEMTGWGYHNPLDVQHQVVREMLLVLSESSELDVGPLDEPLFLLTEVEGEENREGYWAGLILRSGGQWGSTLPFEADEVRAVAERVAARDTPFDGDTQRDQRVRSALNDLLTRTKADMPCPIAIAPMPALEVTSMTGERLVGNTGTLTVGAPVQFDGEHGFVTVAHGLMDPPKGWGTLSNGGRASVVRVSRDWDVALLQCEEKIEWTVPCTSVLEDNAPGRGTRGQFAGQIAGVSAAVVDSVDPILPKYGSGVWIGRLYTNRSTSPGDSGAVLVNGEGQAMGMSVTRTVEGEPLSFSMWTWMAGLLDAVGARLAG